MANMRMLAEEVAAILSRAVEEVFDLLRRKGVLAEEATAILGRAVEEALDLLRRKGVELAAEIREGESLRGPSPQVATDIETLNKFGVAGGHGGEGAFFCIMNPKALVAVVPRSDFAFWQPKPLSRADALNLAAWLVVLAEEKDGDFARVLAAVKVKERFLR